jgi:hypothetical protein
MLVLSFTIPFGIIFVVMIFVITVHLTMLDFNSVYAQKESEKVIKKANVDEKDKLVVESKINLQNISKTGMIKVVGVINGEEFVKNIPLDKVKDSTKKLKVKFEMNKDNELNSAHKPDEFFVCAYHFTNPNNNNNSKGESKSFQKQMDGVSIIEYFDCNEGDIQSTTKPTEANLFKSKSQVYNKTAYYYNMYSKDQVTYFATIDKGNDTATKSATTSNPFLTGNVKQDNNKKAINTKDDNNNKPVKVKIITPMEDKKNAKKIKIVAMLKGQIKSEIVDVQKEFEKIGGYTIERTFAFDRNTDMGPIQVGDRFHACVIGKELYPPEGSECEKRLIKNFEKTNSLAAR